MEQTETRKFFRSEAFNNISAIIPGKADDRFGAFFSWTGMC